MRRWTIGQRVENLSLILFIMVLNGHCWLYFLPVELLFWLVIVTITRTVKILILILHEITLLFIELSNHGESTEKELLCHHNICIWLNKYTSKHGLN